MRQTFALLVFLLICAGAEAQETIRVSGLAYLDYSYLVASPNTENEGENGFGYRRLYLTTDYTLSERFSGRVRFEANDGSTTAEGRPAPFVKDLTLRWRGILGPGHNLTIGITSPPAFTVSERVWGYRSLEKTLMDRQKVLSSRDMGLILRGPLTASRSVRYGFMVANNSGGKAETNRYKRVYGQLEFYPTDALIVTVGGDYAGSGGEVNGIWNANAFMGYTLDGFRFGVEAYSQQTLYDADIADGTHTGISLFAAATASETLEVVGRIDRSNRDVAGSIRDEWFYLGGIAFQPHADVRFIPNILVIKRDADDSAYVTGRVTLHVDF